MVVRMAEAPPGVVALAVAAQVAEVRADCNIRKRLCTSRPPDSYGTPVLEPLQPEQDLFAASMHLLYNAPLGRPCIHSSLLGLCTCEGTSKLTEAPTQLVNASTLHEGSTLHFSYCRMEPARGTMARLVGCNREV